MRSCRRWLTSGIAGIVRIFAFDIHPLGNGPACTTPKLSGGRCLRSKYRRDTSKKRLKSLAGCWPWRYSDSHPFALSVCKMLKTKNRDERISARLGLREGTGKSCYQRNLAPRRLGHTNPSLPFSLVPSETVVTVSELRHQGENATHEHEGTDVLGWIPYGISISILAVQVGLLSNPGATIRFRRTHSGWRYSTRPL